MRYQCFGCKSEWSDTNMVPYCASCVSKTGAALKELKRQLAKADKQLKVMATKYTDLEMEFVEAEIKRLKK